MSLLLTLKEAAGGGGGIISDPSDLGDMTLWYQGGADRMVYAVSSFWYADSGKTTPKSISNAYTGTTSIPRKTINGISVYDLDNGDHSLQINSFPSVLDNDISPFSGRGKFTVAIVLDIPSTLPSAGSVVSQWHGSNPVPRYAGIKLNSDGSGIIGWQTVPINGGSTFKTAHTQLVVAGTQVMWVGTFDYVTKTLVGYLKGESKSVVVSEYNYASSGFPFISVALNATTYAGGTSADPFNILDIVTYDKVLDSADINKLGAYMSDRWGSIVWTDL